MKRLVCICIILVCLLGGSLVALNYIKITRDEMNTVLDEILVELGEEEIDQDRLIILCESACNEWEEKSNIIGTFTIHDTLDILEENFITLRAYATQEHLVSIAPLIEEIKFHLNHLYEMELPKAKNIL